MKRIWKSYKKKWHAGRAIAEAIKSQAWRYMARAEPFAVADEDPGSIDERFLGKVKKVVNHTSDLKFLPGDGEVSGPQITAKMREIRTSELEIRKSFYRKNRIDDQIVWYTRKVKINERHQRNWFWVVGGAQGLAFVAALVVIFFPSFPVDTTGILTTVAASALAWVQVKQYEELAQSYAVTGTDLTFIAELLQAANSEARFCELVQEAEDVMGREHALWLARRDQQLALKT